MNDAETLELARALVRIDSVNPTLVPGAAGEEEIARFVESFLLERGVAAERRDALPGRPNVVARLPGDGAGASLLLCCHMDTVSVDGMEDPFGARVEAGRLYGRGAQDVKGGLAAMLAATVTLSRRPATGGEILVAAVADEEALSAGTMALLREGARADAAIVFEPTELSVAVAHKGFAWLRLHTRGVAAHGSRPEEGVDAIAHMARVAGRLEGLDRALRGGRRHPRLGTGSVHASLIEGGRELSSYPDRCRMDAERRTLPHESEHDVTAEIDSILASLREEDLRFDAESRVDLYRPGYEIAETEPLPAGLLAAARDVTGGAAELTGLTGWTDSALLGAAGIPSVVFGPGGAGLHGLKEYGDIRQIGQARDILVRFAGSWSGRAV